MKRAKLALAIVATMAVAGGAFAVKASKFTGTRYYTTTVYNDVPVGSVIGEISGTNSVYYTTLSTGHATVYAPITAKP